MPETVKKYLKLWTVHISVPPLSSIPLSENRAGSQLELNDEILSGVCSSHCETSVVLHAFYRIPALLGVTSQPCLLTCVCLLYLCSFTLELSHLQAFGFIFLVEYELFLLVNDFFPPRLVPVTVT